MKEKRNVARHTSWRQALPGGNAILALSELTMYPADLIQREK